MVLGNGDALTVGGVPLALLLALLTGVTALNGPLGRLIQK